MSDKFDLIIRNARVARPRLSQLDTLDIAVKDGKFAKVEAGLPPAQARRVVDAGGLLAFPGVVDSHMHIGIYAPLAEDALSESRAAAMGGVTTSINYMRTGKYYLNKSGPYRDFYPAVLEASKDRFFVDYAYHLAPILPGHIDEMEGLIRDFGVPSFKIFMFYGSHGLHGRSDDQQNFLMLGKEDRYDLAHFEFIMRAVRRAMDRFPDIAEHISLSLHCETAEIMRAYAKIVAENGKLKGLNGYHASRPPHSEGLAIFIASYLADETACANINLLHLSSRKAVDAALKMAEAFPHIDFRREVTIGHLMLDTDAACGSFAKVNPPIRPREDVEYLWSMLLDKKIDWVVSDHACCREEIKVDRSDREDIFLAKSGFGGTEYLLPALVSEGRRRGLSCNRIAELTSYNPARRYGLNHKGDIAPGLDADLALVDPDSTWTVRSEGSPSGQGYTPFEGIELHARVKYTFLRGNMIYDGNVIGQPQGRYLHRPC